MMGRREFGLAGLSAAAVVAMRSTGLAQPDERQREGRAAGQEGRAHPGDYAMFDECAQACDECQRECDICTTHCTEMLAQGKKEHGETLRTCQDCADFCSTAARIVARKGPFSADICEPCAVVCSKCGEHCERFTDDPIMKQCADACRACEKACRDMIAHLRQDREGGERRR